MLLKRRGQKDKKWFLTRWEKKRDQCISEYQTPALRPNGTRCIWNSQIMWEWIICSAQVGFGALFQLQQAQTQQWPLGSLCLRCSQEMSPRKGHSAQAVPSWIFLFPHSSSQPWGDVKLVSKIPEQISGPGITVKSGKNWITAETPLYFSLLWFFTAPIVRK